MEKVTCSTLKKMIEKLTRDQEKSNNALLNEMQKVKGELANQAEVIESMKKSLTFFNQQFEDIKMENENIKKEVKFFKLENERLNFQMKEVKKEISNSSLQLDYIERNLKSRNVEIIGVPIVKNENVVNVAVKVMKKVDPQLCENDIESAKQLVKKDKKNEVTKSSILVRFKNINKRNYVYNNKKNLAKAKFSSIDDNIKNVYINENLTPKNKQLFYLANCYRKTNDWKFLWTMNGTVYLREKEGSDAVIIRNVLDLDNLPC